MCIATDSDVIVKKDVNFSKNWEVIFYNDNTTSQEFVIEVLTHIFKYSLNDSITIMKNVERRGSDVVAVLPKKLAEVRVDKTKNLAKNRGYDDFRVDLREEK